MQTSRTGLGGAENRWFSKSRQAPALHVAVADVWSVAASCVLATQIAMSPCAAYPALVRWHARSAPPQRPPLATLRQLGAVIYKETMVLRNGSSWLYGSWEDPSFDVTDERSYLSLGERSASQGRERGTD
jgi:hypothetical protein